VLPLLGENVPESEIDALFALADADSSGVIEYDEFKLLMRGNPLALALPISLY